MLRNPERLAPLVTLFKVLAVLWLVDWWVAGPFYDTYLTPRYITRPLLRDRSAGTELSVLLGAVQRTAPSSVRVAWVGDSTMNAVAPDTTEIPYLIGPELQKRLPEVDIKEIHAAVVGFYCSDALLLIDKLLADGVDVIVYGATLRAFPQHPYTSWVTRMSSEMSPTELVRLFAVGGGDWVWNNLGAAKMLAGFVSTRWDFYAYRPSLRRVLWQESLGRLLPPDSYLARTLAPDAGDHQPAVAPPIMHGGNFEWAREDYESGNPNWQALDLFGALCKRYAPGRCVMYAGPVNPIGRERLVEPAFYQEYMATLRRVAGRYGIIWRDLTDALQPTEFRVPLYERQRDPIHPNEAGRAKLASLLAEAVAEAVRCETHSGPCLGK